MYKNIVIFDTSVSSANLGDQIIMDAVKKELNLVFPDAFFINIQTHDVIGSYSYRHLSCSEYSFVGGTNLLSSNMNSINQWKIGIMDMHFIKGVILMGVGWLEYQNAPNIYTRYLLNRVLSRNLYHAVRDTYTAEKLKHIGIKNVLVTGCPTLWNMNQSHCDNIPKEKADKVVMTLTDYRQSEKQDIELFKILKRNYEKVYLWLQGREDYKYSRNIVDDATIIISPSLTEYDKLLDSDISIDYVGTRLHAGIRAMQHKRRTIIIGIDSRAIEKSKDFHIKVIKREDIELVESMINSKFETRLNIPFDNIEKWKKQFK